MSQLLLRRISKLSLTKKPISAFFSTATTSRSKPYLFLQDFEIKKNTFNFDLYDPIKNKVVVKNLKWEDQSKSLIRKRNLLKKFQEIGSSRGHLLLWNREDSSVHLVDISNQLKAKMIPLPPLDSANDDWSFALNNNFSVSSPVNGDVIVAVKFHESKLSLCRVGDSEWTRIDVPCPSFEDSSLIYSERDERFYLNNLKWDDNFGPTDLTLKKKKKKSSLDGDYTGPIDLTPKSGLFIPVSGYSWEIPFSHGFKNKKGSNVLREQQLVESPCGQSFIVCWYKESRDNLSWDNYPKTLKIVVFKQDEEEKICRYTNDIGDLCIFMGGNEPFCVSAKDYPGLKPNSVYFAAYDDPNSVYFDLCVSDFGVWDLSTQTILPLKHDLVLIPQPYSNQRTFNTFWIPPTPTLPS